VTGRRSYGPGRSGRTSWPGARRAVGRRPRTYGPTARAVVALVVAAGLGLGPAAVPALAAPAQPANPPDTDPQALPVTVSIERLDPRDIRPDTPITVQAVLHNTGTAATEPLKIRLQRGALLTTRDELAKADADPPEPITQFTATQAIAALAPNESRRITYVAGPDQVAQLKLTGVGVYPLAFTVTEAAGSQRVIGQAQTLLPSLTGVNAAPLRVSWLWPLLDRPHRLLTGPGGPPVFFDDGLATSIGPGGRLDRLLTTAESVAGKVSLTLVVDPETIESLQLMTRDYRVGSATRSVPGTGQQVALAWLGRLRRIAPQNQVLALPYGDPDVVALDRASLGTLGQTEQSDTDLVNQVLAVDATSDIAWPPGGLLTDTSLDQVVQDTGAVVLDAAALPGGRSRQTPTPSAVSPLPAMGGRAAALVTDAGLESVVAHAASFPGGPRLAEQRYLAELAMIVAEAPATQRTVVIAPPRRWDLDRRYGQNVLTDLNGSVPWLSSLTAGAVLRDTRPVDRGPLVYPPAAARTEVPGDEISAIGEVQAMVSDFRSALTNEDASELLSSYRNGLRRATSSAWRGDAAGNRAFVSGLAGAIGLLRAKITIQKPSSGVYTLASSDSPLTVTVFNQLSKPVKVKIRIDTRNPADFKVQNDVVQTIPAQTRATVKLQASVQRSGTFAIRASVTSPAGGALGGPDPVPLTVRSTAYGSLALGITIAALGVLIAALIVRMIRRIRHGSPDPEPAGSPAERSLA
jgi:Family of unknown function (DUF6049)